MCNSGSEHRLFGAGSDQSVGRGMDARAATSARIKALAPAHLALLWRLALCIERFECIPVVAFVVGSESEWNHGFPYMLTCMRRSRMVGGGLPRASEYCFACVALERTVGAEGVFFVVVVSDEMRDLAGRLTWCVDPQRFAVSGEALLVSEACDAIAVVQKTSTQPFLGFPTSDGCAGS